ncbi:MAG: bis(5'-nucleosyl)-tetraphosphatase (symmetrical) YqeK [Candidatus Sumerlaeaceae bacterium]
MASHDKIIAELAARLPPKRFLHTLGVVHFAITLSNLHGADTRKVTLAALLHDCAKGLDREELAQMRQEGGFQLSPEDLDFPALWHGPAGASTAHSEFGVEDEEVLDAIQHHTLGHANPSMTLRILIAADTLEPMRDYTGLEGLREAVRTDFKTGLIAVLKEKVAHVNSKGRKPHHRIFETIASLEAE